MEIQEIFKNDKMPLKTKTEASSFDLTSVFLPHALP